MAAPVVDAGSYEVSTAADGKAYTRGTRWASTSPFTVGVSGGTSPQFRIKDPGGTWGAWRSTDLSIVGTVVTTAISIPSASGATASTVTESSAVTISDQGHEIQVRDTASGTAGAEVSQSWTIGGQSGSWSLYTASSLVVYDAPSASTLAEFSNLAESDRYEVTVNGATPFVFMCQNRVSNTSTGTVVPAGRITAAHFAHFSFTGETVSVSVRRLDGVAWTADAMVQPARHSISVSRSTTVYANDTLTFSLTQPRKVVVRNNAPSTATSGLESHPLVILADEPDTYTPAEGDVVFDGGFHDFADSGTISSAVAAKIDTSEINGSPYYNISNNETIYIAGGTIVKGTFRKVDGSGQLSNFTLRGRGMIYAGDYTYIGLSAGWGSGITAWEDGLTGGYIEGLLLVDSPHWNMGFLNDNCEFDDLKILGFHGNTDGIRVGPDGWAHDCFVMTNDDCLLPEGYNHTVSTTVLIEDCVVWHHRWGYPFKLLNTQYYSPNGLTGVQNLTYRNIDILETGVTSIPVFTSPQHDGGTETATTCQPTDNVLFENIYIEQAGKMFYLRPPSNSELTNVQFRNVRWPTPTATLGGTIDGWSGSELVDTMDFEDCYIGGSIITDTTDLQTRGKFTIGTNVASITVTNT